MCIIGFCHVAYLFRSVDSTSSKLYKTADLILSSDRMWTALTNNVLLGAEWCSITIWLFSLVFIVSSIVSYIEFLFWEFLQLLVCMGSPSSIWFLLTESLIHNQQIYNPLKRPFLSLLKMG